MMMIKMMIDSTNINSSTYQLLNDSYALDPEFNT